MLKIFLTKYIFRAIIEFKVISELFSEHFSEYEKNHIQFRCCLCFAWFNHLHLNTDGVLFYFYLCW